MFIPVKFDKFNKLKKIDGDSKVMGEIKDLKKVKKSKITISDKAFNHIVDRHSEN